MALQQNTARRGEGGAAFDQMSSLILTARKADFFDQTLFAMVKRGCNPTRAEDILNRIVSERDRVVLEKIADVVLRDPMGNVP